MAQFVNIILIIILAGSMAGANVGRSVIVVRSNAVMVLVAT